METIDSLRFSFISALPTDRLYKKTIEWLNSRSKDKETGWAHKRFFFVISKKPEEEIIFGSRSRMAALFHDKRNPIVIQFKPYQFSRTEISLEIPRWMGGDSSIINRYPLYCHDFAFEILSGIYGEIPSEFLPIIFPEEVLDRRIEKEKKWEKAKLGLGLILIFLSLSRSFPLNVISLVFLSAGLIDKYAIQNKPDNFYYQMKLEIYTTNENALETDEQLKVR